MEEVFNNDDIAYINKVYSGKLSKFLETSDFTIGFFAESEKYADEIEPSKDSSVKFDGYSFSFIQDFTFEEANILSDINYCKVDGMKFAKIITPFTRSRSYDFIVARSDQVRDVIKSLIHKRNSSYVKKLPPHIIGIPIRDIEKSTIDFLLDEDLRNFCNERDIPLKRGVILEGPPGTGKSMTLKYLRTKADNNDIEFEVFSDIKEFMDNVGDYYSAEKKIFVFEDFDTALLDRENSGGTPNQVLGKILNVLDGVREIDNVVSIFTTNKIKLFDDAFIRPGRIDTVFTFGLPSQENIREYIEKYLFDFDADFVYKSLLDVKSDANISFAFLKGIANDLNIFNFFYKRMPTEEEIVSIIKERIVQSNKGTEKESSSFIL